MADSGSSDDGGFDPDWIFYKDRPDWKDVTPVLQDDGPNPAVQIAYGDRFKDVFNYLRAVMKTNEMSERAFLLTADAISQNPANYSVWSYRRNLLKSLNKSLKEELSYCSIIINQQSKNYQVWQHRKVMIEWLQDPSEELKLIEKILIYDAKNYHAWQYRQWVVKEFNLWKDELIYINSLLDQDVRNNSAWNHRYFVISNTTDFSPEVIESEVSFVKEKIQLAPHNESSWSYLRGVLFLRDFDPYSYGDVWKFCEELYDSNVRSSYLLDFMLQCIEEHLEQADINESEETKLYEKAIDFCKQLAEDIDTIRKEYWNFMSRKFTEKFGKK